MEFIAVNFNKHILPVVAGFVSGYTLGWMVGDNNARRCFQKYYHVPIPQAPMHTFYAYAHDSKEFEKIAEILSETHEEVEKLHTQKQQSKVDSLQ